MTDQQKQTEMIIAAPKIISLGGVDYVVKPMTAGQVKAVLNYAREKWLEETLDPIAVLNREVTKMRGQGVQIDSGLLAEMGKIAMRAASSPTKKIEPSDADLWDMLSRVDISKHVIYMIIKFSHPEITSDFVYSALPDDDSVYEMLGQLTENSGKSLVSEESSPKKD